MKKQKVIKVIEQAVSRKGEYLTPSQLDEATEFACKVWRCKTQTEAAELGIKYVTSSSQRA